MMKNVVEFLQGVVRPIVTLIFAIVTAAGWFLGRLSDDAFLGLAGMVIAFWFQSRTSSPSENGLPPAPAAPEVGVPPTTK